MGLICVSPWPGCMEMAAWDSGLSISASNSTCVGGLIDIQIAITKDCQ